MKTFAIITCSNVDRWADEHEVVQLNADQGDVNVAVARRQGEDLQGLMKEGMSYVAPNQLLVLTMDEYIEAEAIRLRGVLRLSDLMFD